MFSQQTYPFVFTRVPIHSQPPTYQAFIPCFLSSLLISKLPEGGAEDIVALQLVWNSWDTLEKPFFCEAVFREQRPCLRRFPQERNFSDLGPKGDGSWRSCVLDWVTLVGAADIVEIKG